MGNVFTKLRLATLLEWSSASATLLRYAFLHEVLLSQLRSEGNIRNAVFSEGMYSWCSASEIPPWDYVITRFRTSPLGCMS